MSVGLFLVLVLTIICVHITCTKIFNLVEYCIKQDIANKNIPQKIDEIIKDDITADIDLTDLEKF